MKTNLPHVPTKFHQNRFSRFRGVRPHSSNWGKLLYQGQLPLNNYNRIFYDLTFIPINPTCLQNFNKIGLTVSEIYIFKNFTVLNTFVRGSLPLTRMGMIIFLHMYFIVLNHNIIQNNNFCKKKLKKNQGCFTLSSQGCKYLR